MVENNTWLVMVLRATGEASHCPGCRQESRRIHSRYRRRLSDLPWEGIPMRIELRVRRFFCDSEDEDLLPTMEALLTSAVRLRIKFRRVKEIDIFPLPEI